MANEKKEVKYKAPQEGKLMFIPNSKTANSTKMKAAKILMKFTVGKGVILNKEDALKLQNAGFGKIKQAK